MEIKQADLLPLDLLSRPAYSIAEIKDGEEYIFKTINGIEYKVYFVEGDGYSPSSSFASNMKMIGLIIDRNTKPDGRLPKDKRVILVVFEIIYYYLIRNPESILLYSCSEESVWRPEPENKKKLFAKKRSEMFSDWFELWKARNVMAITTLDFVLYNQVYSSCLFREENPHKDEILACIDQVKIEKQ